MKYKNIATGTIVEPASEEVAAMFEANEAYELVMTKAEKAAAEKAKKEQEKAEKEAAEKAEAEADAPPVEE